MPLDIVPDLSCLGNTPVAVELDRLARGEPWFTTQIAGLQFYDYARRDEDLDIVVMPANGDCPPSALLRQIEGLHERRMAGSS